VPEDTANEERYSDFYEELGSKYPESELMLRHADKGHRYWAVQEELKPFAERKLSLIDFGCNDGVYSIPYAKMGARVLGVDISQALAEKATKRAEEAGLSDRCRFMAGNVETFSINERFDVVLFSEVLEHVLRPDSAIRNLTKFTREGGFLLLTTPTPLFEELAGLNLSYVWTLLRGKKLLEEQMIDSGKNETAEYGVRPRSYRHDGYYPRALVTYVESFGYVCSKFYTISFPSRIRSVMSESSARRLPLVKLLGRTNVGVFKRSETRPPELRQQT
jgi:2-polyprenyl-3-methyl-5-hydroxy-6-metoxy-1,4-benzoquinol methylase